MSYTIEPVTPAHVPGYWRVVDAVARERRYLALLEAPPIASTRRFVRDNIKAGNPHYIALHDGEVIGWCDIVRNPRPAMAHGGLLGLGLAAPFRGKGVGTKLMRATIEAAKRARFTRVELTVREDNVRALRLYERLGFVVEGRIARHMRIDGQYFDSLLMAFLTDQ